MENHEPSVATDLGPLRHDRVRTRTRSAINLRIDRQTEERIRHFAGRSGQEITWRLEELEREWDVERALMTQASGMTLAALLMGLFVNKKWLFAAAVVPSFLLQHALQGWCPPVPAFRRLGFRTRREIDREKYALKILRGDFHALPHDREGLAAAPGAILQAV